LLTAANHRSVAVRLNALRFRFPRPPWDSRAPEITGLHTRRIPADRHLQSPAAGVSGSQMADLAMSPHEMNMANCRCCTRTVETLDGIVSGRWVSRRKSDYAYYVQYRILTHTTATLPRVSQPSHVRSAWLGASAPISDPPVLGSNKCPRTLTTRYVL
jgi:hypothetical protein